MDEVKYCCDEFTRALDEKDIWLWCGAYWWYVSEEVLDCPFCEVKLKGDG